MLALTQLLNSQVAATDETATFTISHTIAAGLTAHRRNLRMSQVLAAGSPWPPPPESFARDAATVKPPPLPDPPEIPIPPAAEGVVYLCMGKSCLTRWTVSLHSLRRNYDGPATVFTDDGPSLPRVESIAKALHADVQLCELPPGRCGNHYLLKTRLWRNSPYRRVAFLDADTLVTGPLDELFDRTAGCFVLTRHSLPDTYHDEIRSRLSWWMFSTEFHAAFSRAYSQCHPAINTGIFTHDVSAASVRQALAAWERLTFEGRYTGIPDELAAQILTADERLAGIIAILDDRFNRATDGHCAPRDAVIHHFYPTGVHIGDPRWQAAYRKVRRANIAGIQRWGNPKEGDGGMARIRPCHFPARLSLHA
jgi:hypothetical protein